MKKKIYIISGIIGVLLLVGFIYVVNVGNSIKKGAPHISETINESKEIKAFVAEYKIDSLSLGLNDSLIKYGLGKVKLSDLEYWIEKVWGIDYKYIFLEEINYGKGFRLHITDPTSLKTQEQVFPFIGFKLKTPSQDSAKNGKGGSVCILNIDSIPESINLEIYLSLDHSTDKEIGNIILEKKN